ncbi:MAG TPA: hypothetical protein VE596_04830 [Gaiellaceae bacterium]|jgi:hypothetical protein|nr:hypothetical protein [Gaiellaceae bacterium]
MADLVQVFAQPGPLPLNNTVQIESNEPAIVTLAGSVWAPNPNFTIGIALSIDGSVAGTARIYANASAMHLAVVPMVFSYTFSIGPHTFDLAYLTGDETSDGNDYYVVTVQY